MRIDRVEHAERDEAERRARLGDDDHVVQGAGDHVVSGLREQVVLVGDVPVDRAASRRQPRRERAEGQRVLAAGVGVGREALDETVGEAQPRHPAVRWMVIAASFSFYSSV